MLPASMSSGTERVFVQKAPDFLLGRANRATLHLDLLVASFQEQAFMHTQVGNEVRLRTKKKQKKPSGSVFSSSCSQGWQHRGRTICSRNPHCGKVSSRLMEDKYLGELVEIA